MSLAQNVTFPYTTATDMETDCPSMSLAGTFASRD